MARRRLTPAQPGYLGTAAAPEAKSLPLPGGPPIARVSGQSAEAAALRDLAEGVEAARREGRMIVEVPLGDIAPGHLLRDRVRLDRAELDALKASIRAHGQRTPAEITPLAGADTGASGEVSEPRPSGDDPGLRPGGDDVGLRPGGDDPTPAGAPPYRFGLISGWRRLRALAELYDETGEIRFSTLRALVHPPGAAADAYVAMVEENEVRVGLSYYERARLVAEAAARGVFADQSAALRGLFATASRAKRSKIASFIDIHEQLGDVLAFPAEIPERLGLALVARLRHGDRARLRAALTAARPATPAAEAALLERLARPPRDVSRAKQDGEHLRPGVAMKAARKGRTITLTLSGAAVDDALLDAAQRALRGLGTP